MATDFGQVALLPDPTLKSRSRRRWLGSVAALSAMAIRNSLAGANTSPARYSAYQSPEHTTDTEHVARVKPGTAATGGTPTRFIASARRAEDDYHVVLLDQSAREVDSFALPSRGHGAAVHERSGRAVVFARRPGHFFAVINLLERSDAHFVKAAANRHFYGHGAYSTDGRWLYATENDVETLRGVIGVYDVHEGYRRVAEFDSGGIGPHDVLQIDQAGLLLIANGGIATHPDSGRDKLNINEMAPNIAVVSLEQGQVVSQLQLPAAHHQVSLRHLAFDGRDQVYIAGQYEGPESTAPSLAARLSLSSLAGKAVKADKSQALTILEMPEKSAFLHHNYLTSVSATPTQVAFTSARAGRVLIHDCRSGEWMLPISLRDCSGVARTRWSESAEGVPGPGGDFLVTSGTGMVGKIDAMGLTRLPRHRWQFDNHLRELGAAG